MSYSQLGENDPRIRQPKGLKVLLHLHQLTSIRAMMTIENQEGILSNDAKICPPSWRMANSLPITDRPDVVANLTFIIKTDTAILADNVGAGKTYTILGLILSNTIPKPFCSFFGDSGHYAIKKINDVVDASNVNLIVVPHNLINQWDSMAKNTTIKYITLNGETDFDIFFDVSIVDTCVHDIDNITIFTKTQRRTLPGEPTNTPKRNIWKRKVLIKKEVTRVLQEYNAIILNVKRKDIFENIFGMVNWSRVIIDEVGTIELGSFNQHGRFNWLVTATPSSLYGWGYRSKYIRDIFGSNKDIIPHLIVKNNKEYVDKSILLSEPRVYMINTMVHRAIQAIHDLIPQGVLAMINAGNMKDAINLLNCNIDTEDNIIDVLTNKLETELHKLKRRLKYEKGTVPRNPSKIKNIQTMIQQHTDRINLVHERMSSIKDDCCFICADEFNTPAMLCCCKSVYCLGCLLESLKMNSKCPYCRHVIKSNKDYIVIGKKKKSELAKIKQSPYISFENMKKEVALEHVLNHIKHNDPSPKILIFSDYVQTFRAIQPNLDKTGLTYTRISGTPNRINKILEQFSGGSINILALDSKNYGSGLNLQDAMYVIIFHRMSKELETQVIGRAQRMGRKGSLKIIYLLNNTEPSNNLITNVTYKINNLNELNNLNNDGGFNNDDVLNDDGKSNDESDDDDESDNDSDDDNDDDNDDDDDDDDGDGDDSDNDDDNDDDDDDDDESNDVDESVNESVDESNDDNDSDDDDDESNDVDESVNESVDESNDDNDSDDDDDDDGENKILYKPCKIPPRKN
jgi:hypothetical protein